METALTSIDGLVILTPRTFRDERGVFRETWSEEAFRQATGEEVAFVQDNESRSLKGVLRGLHFQSPPHAQGKLVRCAAGRVLDVAVDIRRGSATFGQHVAIELSADDGRQIWIPPGFAHGFLSLEPHTVLNYKCTQPYAPGHEGALRWDDPYLAIEWGIREPLVSPKDAAAAFWSDFNSPFD